MAGPSIAAIVVTHNRLSLLQECLTALRDQTRKPAEIIVVDNGSTDETAQWLAAQGDLHVVTQPNLGSAGGQYAGIKTAFLHGHAWFWCMDDDTIPKPDALEKLAETPYFQDPTTGFLGSLVLWVDGTPHRMNQPVPVQHMQWYGTVLADRCVRASSCSFVSVMISRSAVEAVGLPLKEMFIWCDDMEYTQRIASRFNGYYVLDSIVVHKTKVNHGGVPVDHVTREEAPKYCYGMRNQVFMFKIQDVPWLRRAIRIIKLFDRNLWMILRGRAPLSVLAWLLRGLVFRPKPEMVRQD